MINVTFDLTDTSRATIRRVLLLALFHLATPGVWIRGIWAARIPATAGILDTTPRPCPVFDPRAECFCLTGIVAKVLQDDFVLTPPSPLGNAVLHALVRAIPENPYANTDDDPKSILTWWNDATFRTLDQVIALFEVAISAQRVHP